VRSAQAGALSRLGQAVNVREVGAIVGTPWVPGDSGQGAVTAGNRGDLGLFQMSKAASILGQNLFRLGCPLQGLCRLPVRLLGLLLGQLGALVFLLGTLVFLLGTLAFLLGVLPRRRQHHAGCRELA